MHKQEILFTNIIYFFQTRSPNSTIATLISSPDFSNLNYQEAHYFFQHPINASRFVQTQLTGPRGAKRASERASNWQSYLAPGSISMDNDISVIRVGMNLKFQFVPPLAGGWGAVAERNFRHMLRMANINRL